MLSIRTITQERERLLKGLRRRHFPNPQELVNSILTVNEERKEAQQQADHLAHQIKEQSHKIRDAIQRGDEKEIQGLKALLTTHKERLSALVHEKQEHEKKLHHLLATLPNLPVDAVPEGKGSEDNVTIKEWWPTQTRRKEKKPPHWEIVDRYHLVDFAAGTTLTGRGFPVYVGKGIQLKRALIAFFLAEAHKAGYTEYGLPLLVNSASAFGTGQLPDKDNMMYHLQNEGFYLIPTAEVPLMNLYRKQVIPNQALPIKATSYTPCFRREAGSWGQQVRGLNRLHQFDKVEIIQITTAGQWEETLKTMCTHVCHLLEQLGLPYRQVSLCAGDLGTTAAITYDIEVWSPGQQKWLEVSSISYCGDYQARRLELRYKEGKLKAYGHTFNGSALALPRVIAALLESYYEEETIAIPAVLHPYLPFHQIVMPA